jgi:hypothetical protein
VGSMATVQLGLLTAETALRIRDAHPVAGAESDQIGRDLRDHRQTRAIAGAHGVGRVVLNCLLETGGFGRRLTPSTVKARFPIAELP